MVCYSIIWSCIPLHWYIEMNKRWTLFYGTHCSKYPNAALKYKADNLRKNTWNITSFLKLGNEYDTMTACSVWEGVLNENFYFSVHLKRSRIAYLWNGKWSDKGRASLPRKIGSILLIFSVSCVSSDY